MPGSRIGKEGHVECTKPPSVNVRARACANRSLVGAAKKFKSGALLAESLSLFLVFLKQTRAAAEYSVQNLSSAQFAWPQLKQEPSMTRW